MGKYYVCQGSGAPAWVWRCWQNSRDCHRRPAAPCCECIGSQCAARWRTCQAPRSCHHAHGTIYHTPQWEPFYPARCSSALGLSLQHVGAPVGSAPVLAEAKDDMAQASRCSLGRCRRRCDKLRSTLEQHVAEHRIGVYLVAAPTQHPHVKRSWQANGRTLDTTFRCKVPQGCRAASLV